MKNYLTMALIYLAAALAIVFVVRDDVGELLAGIWRMTAILAPRLGGLVAILGVGVLAMVLLTRVNSLRTTMSAILMAFTGTLLFHAGFAMVKTSLPYMHGFFADRWFAQADKALHGGVDPWVLAHSWAANLPMDWIVPFYVNVWVWPALCLPLIIAATDRNAERVTRTLIMYVVAWVGLGNVMALAGLSAGPVYYDRLLGEARFEELTVALTTPDLARIARLQEWLWQVYTEQGQAIGSGISAFPSVHVGVAVVTAFYLFERSKWLAPLAVGFVVIIQFLSVYTGYHYALDGYASIIVMAGVWLALRRLARKPFADRASVPAAA